MKILFIYFFLNSFCRSRQRGTMPHSACTDSKRRGQEDRRIQGKAKATTEKGWVCIYINAFLPTENSRLAFSLNFLAQLPLCCSLALLLTYKIIYWGTVWGFHLDGYTSVPTYAQASSFYNSRTIQGTSLLSSSFHICYRYSNTDWKGEPLFVQ